MEREPRIRVMDPSLANQIAAGEVVERPASVVKELIENALDAGATRIELEATAGGRSLLRITDNGSGMNQQEAILAFERFATSKLTSADDLEQIGTLGFRGEALPSIASVAKILLLTREPDSPEGTRVEINYGEVLDYSTAGCPVGTSLTIRDLFRNVPARLKYLRAPGTEARHITERVQLYVLAFPEVEWRLVQDEKMKLLHNTGRMDGALLAVLGREAQQNLIPVEQDFGSFKVSGYLSQPSFGKASRAYQFFFVNRRPVESKMLSYAVFDAYQGLITPGQHPVVVLNLTMPTHLVDPNVHPQKLEVRFAHSLQVLEQTREALRGALDAARGQSGLRPTSLPGRSEPAQPFEPGRPVEQSFGGGSAPFSNASQPTAQQLGLQYEPPSTQGVRESHLARELQSRRDSTREASLEDADLVPLGAFHNTYLLVARGQDLMLIDQHAAHERILYDRFQQDVAKAEENKQELLTPLTLELTSPQYDALSEHLELLAKLGFGLEPFGETTLLVTALPNYVASGEAARVITEFADEILESGDAPDVEAKVHSALATMACKAAVKAGEPLSYQELVALLRDLLRTTSPYTCPHGRPTTVALSLDQLEKLFKRK